MPGTTLTVTSNSICHRRGGETGDRGTQHRGQATWEAAGAGAGAGPPVVCVLVVWWWWWGGGVEEEWAAAPLATTTHTGTYVVGPKPIPLAVAVLESHHQHNPPLPVRAVFLVPRHHRVQVHPGTGQQIGDLGAVGRYSQWT